MSGSSAAAPIRVLAIIPALDEADAIGATIADLRRTRPDLDVVVVDDGSTDHTARIATDAGAQVLVLPFNLGIGGALRTGFRWAVERGYDRAVQFDADGQHDAGSIAALFAELDAGADLVIGSRFADEALTYDIGRIRRSAMGILRVAVRLLAGARFTDTSSGFRAFSRPMLEHFARTYPVEYMESTESLVAAAVAGYRVVEVPVTMQARQGGQASSRRFRLVYHYVRVLFVMLVSAGRRRAARPEGGPS